MRKLLTSKSGVTLLEGVVALGLLALVAGGAFGVLLSASRQNTQPDVREEMVWAVEKAYQKLHAYVGMSAVFDEEDVSNYLPDDLKDGLCGAATGTAHVEDSLALLPGQHNIPCMLPPICDRNNNSSFTYTVEQKTLPAVEGEHGEASLESADGSGYKIKFQIRCNGYKL